MIVRFRRSGIIILLKFMNDSFAANGDNNNHLLIILYYPPRIYVMEVRYRLIPSLSFHFLSLLIFCFHSRLHDASIRFNSIPSV